MLLPPDAVAVGWAAWHATKLTDGTLCIASNVAKDQGHDVVCNLATQLLQGYMFCYPALLSVQVC
jgi:hypothetical protein